MVRAIIVDDEDSGRRNLYILIKEYCKEIDVVDVAVSINTAYTAIEEHKPDVVFLDIQMPDGNGFELLDMPISHVPLFVFVTAHKNFAIDAIKNNAFDYILKPIDIEELKICENKLLDVVYNNEKVKNVQNFNGQHKITLRGTNGVHIIELADIIYLEAKNNYTIIHTVSTNSDNKYTISQTLGGLEENLPDIFYRIHKSYIVNIENVNSVARGRCLIMKNNVTLEVSRRKAHTFRNFLMSKYPQLKSD